MAFYSPFKLVALCALFHAISAEYQDEQAYLGSDQWRADQAYLGSVPGKAAAEKAAAEKAAADKAFQAMFDNYG